MDDDQAGAGMDDAGEVGVGYDEWRCTACGHSHPKHTPPCDSCGHMELERIHVSATDFDDELVGASWLALLRENALLVLATVVVVATVGGVVATSSGVFVLSDPFGWGYRWGTVGPADPGSADPGSAAGLRGELDRDLTVESLAWRGRHLELAYRSDAASSTGFERELETVALAYARYVDAGGDAARLDVSARGPGGRQRSATVERRWAVAFNEGDLGHDEYVDRVADGGSGSG